MYSMFSVALEIKASPIGIYERSHRETRAIGEKVIWGYTTINLPVMKREGGEMKGL